VETAQHPSSDEWINKMWYTHTMKCYSAITKMKLIRATTWMNLEHIMLSERSQSQKSTYCLIPLNMKLSRIGKLIETEIRLEVTSSIGKGDWELLPNG